VFRTGIHATSSESSARKLQFSSAQERSQQQPKDSFLEEHINVSNIFEINETRVKFTIVYPSRNVAIPTLRQAIHVAITGKTSLPSRKQ
jgi:hypothetical protein